MSVNTLEVECERVRNSVKESLLPLQSVKNFIVNEYLVFVTAILLLRALGTLISLLCLSFLQGYDSFNRRKKWR